VDFEPTEAQRELAALVRTVVTDHPENTPLWTELARTGVLSAALPIAAGGDGFGLLEQCAVLVELGRGLGGVPYLESIVVAASALAEFGTPEQVERWAAPAGRGELVLAAALGAGPVTAEPTADGWRLTGVRTAVAGAPAAALLLVPATVDSGRMVVFLVDTTVPGITIDPQLVAGSPGCGLVTLDNAPTEATLGPTDNASTEGTLGPTEGSDGAAVLAWLEERAAVGACATQLGVCERALELTAEYAGNRKQFGRPIGAFQAVAARLADAYLDVEAVRLSLWQAAWRLSAGLDAREEVATAAFWAADAGYRVAHTTVHIHGGVGIDLTYPVHRYFLGATYHEFQLGGATRRLHTLGDLLAA
jgi:acyl-CoA dehydrogenase